MFTKRSLAGLLLTFTVVVVAQVAPRGGSVAAAVGCPTTLTYGAAPVACTISAAKEIDVYGLSAAAGDAALVHVVGAANSGLDVDIDVRDAAKKIICSARAGASAEVLCPLPAGGRYAVSVFDSGGDETGAYRVDVQRANRPVGATGLSVARPRKATLRSAGANNWYTFAGAAKVTEVVRAVAVGTSPIEVDLEVYSPKGEALCSARAGVTAQVACPLPVAGRSS